MSYYTLQKAVIEVYQKHFIHRILCEVAVIEITPIGMLMLNGLVSARG